MKNIFLFLGVAAILLAMGAAMLSSARQEATVYDETAHLAAGLGYLTEHQYILNPEHPPVFKLLAAVSVQSALHLKFPANSPLWTSAINQQFEIGKQLFYDSGYNAQAILFWGRLPLIALTLLFGLTLFIWVYRRYGSLAGGLVVLLFSLSPTILAHGHYITNDVSAAFGLFLGIASYIAFLERPKQWWRLVLAGALFGVAQLMKFSLALLVPMDLVILLLWQLLEDGSVKQRSIQAGRLLWKTVVIGLIGLVVIYGTYFFANYNQPTSRQVADTTQVTGALGLTPSLSKLTISLAGHRVTQPLAEYMLGVLMASRRAQYGGGVFLLGQNYQGGKLQYFPLIYLFKETLMLHLLTLLAFGYVLYRLMAAKRQGSSVLAQLKRHRVAVMLLVAWLIYWLSAIFSGLNIGLRHILPTLPLLMILIAVAVSEFYQNLNRPTVKLIGAIGLIALLSWGFYSVAQTAPSYISYYNELAQGTNNGYKIAVDSNYDWGQDLLRLQTYVNDNNIPTIGADLFTSADPAYYLGNRYVAWDGRNNPYHGWFAISLNTYAPHLEATNFGPTDPYYWLSTYQPVARVGTSILVFHLP